MAKIACVQMDVAFGQLEVNVHNCIEHLQNLAAQGVELAVFPECALTGYCVDSKAMAETIAIDKACLAPIQAACNQHNIICVVGFAEMSASILYNTAALIEPFREPRYYRKSHLPELGYDKFVQPGDSIDVFETRIGRIGIAICFDLRGPETCRVLGIKGADLICLPTNWPNGAQISANVLAPARAVENRVFLAACNRVGHENGFDFIGLSGIYGITGNLIAKAEEFEQVLVADVELETARNKRITNVPGKYEMTVFESRRPELYDSLVE